MSEKSQQGRVMRAVVNYGLGGMAPKIVNFLLLPLYTVYVDPESFGKLEIFFGAQLLLLVVMRGGLPSAVARLFFDERTDGEFGSLVLSSLVASVLIGTGVSVAFVVGFPYLADAFFELGTLWPWVPLTCLAAAGQLLMEFQRRLLQAKEESGLAARLGASQAILTTILSLAFVLGMKLGGLGIMIGASVSSGVFGVIGLAYLRPYLAYRFDKKLLREATNYAAPLVPHHVLAVVFQHAGRWVLAAYSSVAVTGHLAFAGRLTSPLVLITGAFSAAFSPVYYGWRATLSDADCHTEVRRVGTSLTALGALLAMGVTFGSVLVVRHFVADAYAPALLLIGPLALAQYLQLIYTFVVVEVFFAKRTRLIPVMFLWASAANIISLFLLVPRFDGMGAVLSQMIGSVVSTGVAIFFARQTFPLPVSARPLLMSFLAAATSCVVVTVLPHYGMLGDALMVSAAFLGMAILSLLLSGTTGAVVRDLDWIFQRARARFLPVSAGLC